jgi:hypothetical protein
MIADPATHPLSLRVHLRDLQRALDEAAAGHFAHRREHGCREGTCAEGKRLAQVTSDAQFALSMTRFLNDD